MEKFSVGGKKLSNNPYMFNGSRTSPALYELNNTKTPNMKGGRRKTSRRRQTASRRRSTKK